MHVLLFTGELTVTATSTQTNIEVNWEFDSNCPNGHNNYYLSWGKEGDSHTDTQMTEENNYTIHSLQPCTTYVIEVQPMDEKGSIVGMESNTTTIRTLPSGK